MLRVQIRHLPGRELLGSLGAPGLGVGGRQLEWSGRWWCLGTVPMLLPGGGEKSGQEGRRVSLKLPEIGTPRQPPLVETNNKQVAAAVALSNRKLLKLQVSGLRRVKRMVAHRRDDKEDRRRMVDLDVAHSVQVEKMEAYKTSMLSQKRSLVTTKEEERLLSHMPTEAMEAALAVSRKVGDVKSLGREQIQSTSPRSRSSRDRAGILSERSERRQPWAKVKKHEPMSARMARAQGWDSRAIPDQVASKLKYTLSFVKGMERTHGRPRRALDVVRRELDRNGLPHAQPPGMVNEVMSRDEKERVDREVNQQRSLAHVRKNLKSFHASGDGDGTVADAMLLHDNYLEWKLDSRPIRPDEDSVKSWRSGRTGTGSADLEAQLPSRSEKTPVFSGASRRHRKSPSPITQLARSIALEVGVKTKSAKAALDEKLEEEPNWGKQTRRTMRSMGVADGGACC